MLIITRKYSISLHIVILLFSALRILTRGVIGAYNRHRMRTHGSNDLIIDFFRNILSQPKEEKNQLNLVHEIHANVLTFVFIVCSMRVNRCLVICRLSLVYSLFLSILCAHYLFSYRPFVQAQTKTKKI